uniref:Putative ap2-associated protein kinase 1 n=1 Tax=Culex tarsalis TaxID=7177 RepID=A0A1Q3EXG5_CULTA
MPQHYKSQLAALIKVRGQAGFSEYEVLKIFCDVCESLAVLHCCQAPVIYRDVKVENVVQNDMGRFILAESGSATARFLNPVAHGKKVVEEEVQKNTSLPYRAPEMVDLNSGHSITTKVDIWAAGVLLYKLCFGTMPFGESSKAILHCQYNIPEKCKYSPELCQLIRFLLEPDPEKRPNIYQVCELAFKISGKDNPLRIARERQRTSQVVTTTSNNSIASSSVCSTEQQHERKFQTAVISGTSVAPRSRPKPQLTGASAPFTLGPPPLNPSPKNVVSPVPGVAETDRAFVANFSENFPKATGGVGGAKSPAVGGNEAQDAGFRFIPSDSKHLLVPPMEAAAREKSATVSPASLLLSPFEQPSEPPSSSSSSTRPRPTTLLASASAAPPAAKHRHRQAVVACVLSNSNSEKSLVSPCSSSTWNPFGDPSPFSPNSTLTEDQLFGAEFDKLRLDGGSQTSIVTSPEEMKFEQQAVPDSWLQQKLKQQHQRFSLPALNQVALDGSGVVVEEDPFGSAPFTLPKRLKDKAGRSSKLTSKLSEVISSATSGGTTLWRHSTGGGKESLITATTPGASVGENGAVGNGEVEGMLGIKLDDLMSGGDKGSPNFIKLPLDDRNKYEKLNSNDVTSDDSDSEFYPDLVGGGLKKQSFKQFVENNIPEKLQAVYHKVDKGQIKNVQIVKKLRGKVVNKDEVKRKKEKRVKTATATVEEQDERESDDSIGSASDLRANDDFVEGDEVDSGQRVAPGKPGTRRFNRGAFGDGSVDDCISESIKTCGSSAYHAECESVTTNEDNSSRIVTRVRVKKREHDSKHSVIDEDDSGEEDMLHGDKPLLLDDELDYESAPENNTSGEDVVLMDPFTPESLPDESEKQAEEDEVVLDPFAMAPFRKPTVPKRNSIIKYLPNVVPIPENCPTVTLPPSLPLAPPTSADNFCTSTPVKPTRRSLPEATVLPLKPPIAEIVPLSPPVPKPRTDLFGSEPFPAMVLSTPQPPVEPTPIPTVSVEPGSVALTHIIPSAIPKPQILPEPPTAAPPALKQPPLSTPMTARLTYINFGQIPSQTSIPSIAAVTSISPDNNYVNFAPDGEDDDARKLKSDEYDSSEPVVKSSSKASGTGSGVGFLKKDKVRYNSLKEKLSSGGGGKDDSASVTSSTTSTGNHVLVIPSKLSSKVKVNVSGYKKVSSKLGKKDKSVGNGAPETEQHHRQTAKVSKKMGFSNMSFEDFPSDDALEEQQPAVASGGPRHGGSGVGGKLMKIAPFEVIRNEKMLLEAEKKFGSLKRRSNPFS